MIELNPVFRQIFTTEKRYIVITGGRGSAKSFGVNTSIALTSYEKGHKFLHTRYALTTAEDSIIPEFKEKIDLLEVPHHFTVQKDNVYNRISGSEIKFRGIKTTSGDQTAKLKSLQGITDWILDEAEELTDEKKFDDIDYSIRGKTAKNRIILILNPTTKEHWIWKRWFQGHLKYITIDGFQIPVSAHPDILHIHLTYLDNPHLDEALVNLFKKLKYENPEKYRHKILGGWLEKAEGVIFENWEIGDFNTYLPYCYGLDFGYSPDPIGLIKTAVDKRKMTVYWAEKLYETKLSTENAIKAVKGALDHRFDLIIADTSEPRLFTAMKAAGLNIRLVSKKMYGRDGSVITDIRDLQDFKIIVDPNSPNLITELNNYAWNDKKASIPVDDYNHLIDPGRYSFRRLFPFRQTRGMRQKN